MPKEGEDSLSGEHVVALGVKGGGVGVAGGGHRQRLRFKLEFGVLSFQKAKQFRMLLAGEEDCQLPNRLHIMKVVVNI